MNNSSQPNFFDKRTLIAVGFMAVFFVGWQMYLAKKYPQGEAKPVAEVVAQGNTENAPAGSLIKTEPSVAGSNGAASTGAVVTDATLQAPTESELVMDYKNWKLVISSLGMGIKEVVLKDFKDRHDANIVLGKSQGKHLYGLKLNGFASTPNFEMTKVSETEVSGVATVEGVKVTRSFIFNPETYSVRSTVKVENTDSRFNGITIFIPDEKHELKKSSMFMPQFEFQDFVVKTAGKVERLNITAASDPVDSEYKTVSMAGLGSQYFTTAIVDHSKVIPTFKTAFSPTDKLIVGELNYGALTNQAGFVLDTVGFFGPKSHSTLKAVDEELVKLIDFGMFSFLAYPLLAVLKMFFGFVGNWGFAIILLTILVRLAVLPFNLMSYKSMKAMQKVNPLIQGLRERYKDDPQTLNREMMELFKVHKVNPMGGCLPMLLQIPVFFALYQVLGQSIELYQAPFLGWIHDLSLKDPYFILPVAMGISMFVQQKITPTTMDPTQAKIMLFMPILFSLMMFSLPSGLTLYIFVSTLFAIFQQVVFMRDKTT